MRIKKTHLLTIIFLPLQLLGISPTLNLSIEEKVGQILMVHFQGNTINDDVDVLLNDLHIGNIIYYNWANGLETPLQVATLSKQLQQINSQKHALPLLIAADQEGGVVARLNGAHFAQFPGNGALGKIDDCRKTRACAYAMGQQLRSCGINFNLAPVVDIAKNSRSPLDMRAFGGDPERVTAHAASMLEGLHEASILTSLKHFPGLGDVAIDSHEDKTCINKTIEMLDKEEFVPFKQLAMCADTVMVGHMRVTAYDAKHPATLSKTLLEEVLRKKIGFQGVIISDSLVMEGFLKCVPSIDEGAIACFNAGCDIIILGGRQLHGTSDGLELTVQDVRRIADAFVAAVKEGRISQERLDEAVERIAALKSKIMSDQEEIEMPETARRLSREIAAQALESMGSLTMSYKKIVVVAPIILKEAIEQVSFGKNHAVYYTSLNPTEKERQELMIALKGAKGVIACSYNAYRFENQRKLIEKICNKKPTIVICTRNPEDKKLFKEANGVITTYSPSSPSLQAAFDLMR